MRRTKTNSLEEEMREKNMKTLIVGGTGLVGAETARLMASKGHEVTLCPEIRLPTLRS